MLSSVDGRKKSLLSACIPVLENLEGRRLLSTSTVQTLPFSLDFSSDKGEILDKDGQGTGLTRVQANKSGTQYQANLIDLDTTKGVLKITTTAGSNSGTTDNTQVDALETQFNGTGSTFTIQARLLGPLSFINAANQQGGIYFGPDQDNFVKLVAVYGSNGPVLQFKDELGGSTSASLPSSVQNINVGSFANINTLDLRIIGDPSTGKISGAYSINGGSYVNISSSLTLSSTNKAKFFTSTSRAGVMQNNKGAANPITVTYDNFSITAGGSTSTGAHPSVSQVRPRDKSINVPIDAFVAADVDLVSSGIDPSTLSGNVILYRTSDHKAITGVINTSGGGDAIVFQPTDFLDKNTSYTFQVFTGLKDTDGHTFNGFTSTFTTGSQGGNDGSMAFDKQVQASTQGQTYTSVVVGPDHKLYATTIDGLILRFNINSDGSLSSPQTISTVKNNNGGARALTSIVFDPSSTANNLIAYVSHSDGLLEGAADWTGKVSKLTGSNLGTYQDLVVGLPRSVRDHMTNQLVFGPDGKLYFEQAAMNAMGAPDAAWGMRAEHLLSSAILQLDLSKLSSTPLNVRTEGVANPYNPFAANAPLKIYASGVRNAYDLVWADNGHLYAPTNGSAANGNTPASPNPAFSNSRIDEAVYGDYNGPVVPGITKNTQTEHDWLFDVKSGKYYGHPNPSRYEWVMNGGNPTSGTDPFEVPQYPVGTQPDRNYGGVAFDFFENYSPDGAIQYHGNAFGGALDGKLMIVRYSGGDDIIVLKPNANGTIDPSAQTGISGARGFTDPVDLIEDNTTGYIYVAEYGGQQITLLKPISGGNVKVSKSTLYMNDVKSGSTDPGSTAKSQQLTITNNGTGALTFSSGAFSISGTDAGQYSFVAPTLPKTLQPGESFNITVNFNATSVGIKTAQLTIHPDAGLDVIVRLRGIGMNGTEVSGGLNEPSLQRILDLFEIPDQVGDNDPTTTAFPASPTTPNDEVALPRLVKASDGNVSIELLSVFDNLKSPSTRFGYYTPGTSANKTELFTTGLGDAQSVNPTAIGNTTFDPGSGMFSLYGIFPAFTNRAVYSEDSLNTWEPNVANRRKIRFYPLKNSDGSIVNNAYVFAFEEYDKAYDQNDIVGIIRNVKAAAAGAEIGLENVDGVPFADRLVFNRIENLDPLVPNVTHDTATLLVRNTGSSTLNISQLVLSGPFTFVSGGGTTSIAAGGSATLKIKFTGVGTGLTSQINGTLTIVSDDSDEPNTVVNLAGFWQKYSEQDPSGKYGEPTLQQVVQTFGYGTQVQFAGQSLDTKGKPTKIGEEILSAYWKRVDTNAPVIVRMLAAMHKESSQDTSGNLVNTNSVIKYFYQGASSSATTLFRHNQNEGQSFLPHIDGSTTNYAMATFNPTTSAFGFKVDSRYSDDSLNPLDFDPNDPNQTGIPGTGHAFRFYALKDGNGNLIPNTYLIAQDYTGISYSNYDYQDNIYIVSNVKPTSGPSAVAGLVASGSTSGVNLSWNKNTEGNVAGYRVYRSDSANGTFTLLNTTLISSPNYLDINAPTGVSSFYRVSAVDVDGNESAFSTANAIRPSGGTVTINAPTNLQLNATDTQVGLSWTDNSDNENGFKVMRKVGNGSYSVIFTTASNATSYTDTNVTVGTTYTYKVVATNGSIDSADSNEQTVTIQSTPPTQGVLTSADIGNPTPGGSTNTITDGKDYDVTAGGDNIWGTSDQFRYVYKQVTGDFDVKVQVLSLTDIAGVKPKAGIMARSSLDASASNAFARVNPTDANGPRLSYRLSDGASSNTSGSGNGTAPIWVRLQRVGNTFTAYRSPDGVNWTKIGSSQTITMGSTIYLGLATASNSVGQTTTAQYRSFSDTFAPTVTTPDAPTGLSAIASSPTQIDLSWADNSSNEDGFKIQRRTSGGQYQTIFTTGPGVTSYSDKNLDPSTLYFYQILATNSAGDSTPSNEFGVSTLDQPPAGPTFTSNDVGNPAPAGSTNALASDQYDVSGGGTDVWGSSDQFQFESAQLTGDFDVKVRVNSATFAPGTNPLLGLMARETLGGNSKNVFMRTYGSAGGQYKFAYRSSTGGTTSSVTGANNSYPNTWLRLKRVGNTFTGYSSSDGVNWTQTGTITISMASTIYVGMAVSSRSASSTATAQFRDLTIA